ncbi:MAG: hypothetical protein WC829_21725 [Hyphomicrobium sp.]|jgi:hypothetical protein
MQGTDATGTDAPPSAAEMRLQRNLKIVVVVLGVLLFAGLAAIIGRIIYLASGDTKQPVAVSREGAIGAELSMQLPVGAEVRSMSLSGDRLAVHYAIGAADGIAIIDLRSGKPLASVDIERSGPAK